MITYGLGVVGAGGFASFAVGRLVALDEVRLVSVADVDQGRATELASAHHAQVMCTVELLWIPLGAGQHVVRISGRIFESLVAFVQRRPACDIFHSALIVTVPDGRYVIEMTPISDVHGDRRGVVAEGAVGATLLGKLRVFRYEIHRWRNGVIPDADQATKTTILRLDLAAALRLIDLASSVPTPVWGRDELGAGEMWNSNSVTSWVLHRGGIDTTQLAPPDGGRAPGWDAGLVVASRTGIA